MAGPRGALILIAVVLLLVVALAFGPQWWVQRVMREHANPRDDLPGTGGELARHLLDNTRLGDVPVETTETGDHYDPRERVVRLLPGHAGGKSLTAVTVAAHEVGHALQHRDGYALLMLRTRLAAWAAGAEKLGVVMLMGVPLVMLLLRTPAPAGLLLLAGLLAIGSAAVVHLVTLPVELDASFNRALPILAAGYLDAADLPAARRILAAAALTYVAASLASLLNLGRWLLILRR